MRFDFRMLAAGLAMVSLSAAPPRSLSFQERVNAAERIERTYYVHQIGARRSFEQVSPRSRLEAKVAMYLRESEALETIWGVSIGSADLERELDRVNSSSRATARLREIQNALGNDELLLRECLARPLLVDRLTRHYYAWTPELHQQARSEIEALRVKLKLDGVDALAKDPHRSEQVITFLDPASLSSSNDANTIELSHAGFVQWRFSQGGLGDIGAVEEVEDAFVVRVLLEETPDHARVATFSVRKKDWSDWWAEFPERSGVRFPVSTAVSPNAGAPVARCLHTAVWTRTHMLIWGGSTYSYTNTGAAYDPATDSWIPISTTNAPSARASHTAVWSGNAMIIWGGSDDLGVVNTGGRYDPATDTWSPASTMNAPSPRRSHACLWTGNRMIVWGGFEDSHGGKFNTGGRYDPDMDTWVPTTLVGAPVARDHHVAVWTGDRMIVWGGSDSGFENLRDGGEYDPIRDRWMHTNTRHAPSPRRVSSAVWTGTEMIVWGGNGDNKMLKTGGRYDPATAHWTPTDKITAPAARNAELTVWTGSEMIVWGGEHGNISSRSVAQGGRYDPSLDTWTQTSMDSVPPPAAAGAAVWTGESMIVWGGSGLGGVLLDTGGVYDPVTDTWAPTAGGTTKTVNEF